MKSLMGKLSIDYCTICKEGHSLIYGVCFDCRQKALCGIRQGENGWYSGIIQWPDGDKSAITCSTANEVHQWLHEHGISPEKAMTTMTK